MKLVAQKHLQLLLALLLIFSVIGLKNQTALAEAPTCFSNWSTTDSNNDPQFSDCGSGLFLNLSTSGNKLYGTENPVTYKKDKCYVTVGASVAELPNTAKTPDGKDFPSCDQLKFVSTLGKRCYASYTAPSNATAYTDTNQIPVPGTATQDSCYSDFFYNFGIPRVAFADGTSHEFRKGYCYVTYGYGLAEIAAAGQPPVANNPAGLPTCEDLATWAESARANPPRCFNYDKDSLDDLTNPKGGTPEHFDTTKLKEITCADRNAYFKYGPTGQPGSGAGSGADMVSLHCYVFSNNLAVRDLQCYQLDFLTKQPFTPAAGSTPGSGPISPEDDCKINGNCKVNSGQIETGCADAENCDFMNKFIYPIAQFLAYGVGFVIVIVTVAAGIRYSAAGSDPQKAGQAKKMISNAVLALITYIFLYAILKWLLPDGLI